MLDENGVDEVTKVIEDVKSGADKDFLTGPFKFYARHCIIIRYDARLVAAESVVTMCVFILCAVIYLIMESNIVADPTEEIKSGFLMCQTIALLATTSILFIYNVLIKTKEVLATMLKILLVSSIAVLLTLLIYKINMNKTYTKDFYRDYFKNEAYKEYGDGNRNTAGINITGIKYTTVSENYVERCMNSYFKFTIRSSILFVAQIIEIGLIVYVIIGLKKIEKIKDDLEKNDKILLDDEINCRY